MGKIVLAVIDFSSWTTYLQAGLAATLAWIVKTLIQQGKDQIKLQTIVEYYIERQTKDAAIRLEQVSNPTPPDMQELLRKFRYKTLTFEEHDILITWIKTLDTNPNAEPAERSAALQLLTGIETSKEMIKLKTKRHWWQFS